MVGRVIERTPVVEQFAFKAAMSLALPGEFVPVTLLGLGQLGERSSQALDPRRGYEFTGCHGCSLLRSLCACERRWNWS